jgi:hypothetical protein
MRLVGTLSLLLLLGVHCTTPVLVKRTCAHETVFSFQALINRVDSSNSTGDLDLFGFVLSEEAKEDLREFIQIRDTDSDTPEEEQLQRELDQIGRAHV